MTREAQLEWEARAGRPAAAAAIASLLSFLAAGIVAGSTQAGLDADEFLEKADESSAAVLAPALLQAIAVLLFIPVLLYLYRVTRYRRPRLPQAAQVLAIVGPVVAAGLAIGVGFVVLGVAPDFVDSGVRTEDRAEDLLRDSALPTLRGISIGANIAVGFAIILIAMNAMRAGVLSRFMGVLGIIVGVFYVIPLGLQLIQFFWLGALAILFLDRWPSGRGPAWEAGEALPWPTAAEQRMMLEQRAEAQAEPALEAEPEDAEARQQRRKRKRKR